MKNNLTTTQNTDLVLKKSKSMLNITNRILSGKTALTKEVIEDWIKELWAWADDNDIGDLEWVEDVDSTDGGYFEGLPRKKDKLLGLSDLRFKQKKIKVLSSAIGDLKNLKKLYLAHNNLTTLPTNIINLHNLTHIHLHTNQFKEIPLELFSLKNLIHLCIGTNQITEIPKEISTLLQLEDVYIGGNKLTKLPKEIGELSNLVELKLHDNQLTELPKEIGNLINLKILAIYGNKFIELPEEITNLKNLTILAISDNTSLSLNQQKWIETLISNGCLILPVPVIEDWIKELWDWADSNDIHSDIIPREKDLLLALKTINLSGLGLETLTSRLCFVEYVTTLVLADNHIKELPKEIVNFRNLKLLNLKNNPLVLTPMQERWIEQLKEKGCEVYLGSDLVKSQNSDLVDESWIERLWAWAEENGIGDLEWVQDKNHNDRGYYGGLPRDKKTLLELTELYLWKNQLIELPKEIGNLSSLRKLYLWNNQLTELPKEIWYLSNLTNLHLGRNQLTELPKEIGNLYNLTRLHLGHNQLRELPKEIENFSDLRVLYLKDNPNLILSIEQKAWIKKLENNDCDIFMDDDLLERISTPQIDINEVVLHPDIIMISGLMWQKETVEEKMNWNDAMEYAKNLRIGGYDDWRLPSIDELKLEVINCGGIPVTWEDDNMETWEYDNYRKIRDKNEANDYYQSSYKEKGFKSSYYWSSSTFVSSTNHVWDINFYYGYTNGNSTGYSKYVRCVRVV